MKKTLEKRRIDAVKSKFIIFPRYCQSCMKTIIFKKVWCVKRWGVNKTVQNWYYCKECMPKPEDVIHEIDTDHCPFGIAFVDSHILHKNK